MSEANEVTETVERVREHLAAAVGIGHPDEEGYIDFLTEILAALTAATERAEAAEARRDLWEKRARKVVQERRALRVECEALRELAKTECDSNDALRKDAARYRLMRGLFRYAKWDDVDALHELKPDDEKYIADDLLDAALDCALTAAMAVQP